MMMMLHSRSEKEDGVVGRRRKMEKKNITSVASFPTDWEFPMGNPFPFPTHYTRYQSKTTQAHLYVRLTDFHNIVFKSRGNIHETKLCTFFACKIIYVIFYIQL